MSSATPSARAYTGAQKPYVSVIIEGDGAALKDTSHNGSINNAKHPRFNSKPRESSFFRWWLFELLASVISIASLISLVLVLRHYSGRGLQELDLPYSLTLNGIVAAISTVNRVALMVPVGAAMSQEAWLWFSRQKGVCRSQLADLEDSDAASRGAWGSFLFLCKARRRYLAYLGATVTILSLAFGTFTQQLLSIENYPIAAGGNAAGPGNMPRSRTWQQTAGDIVEGGLTAPLSMKAAVYNGILGGNVTTLPALCETETENSTFAGDINANITFSVLPVDKSLGVHANYTFLYQAYIGLTTFLSPLLTGNITFDDHDETSSSDWTQAIWEASPDLDQWINNLAVGMTNVVRAGAPALDPTYNGTAYQLGVSVRWWWLALPVAMVVLSLTFLIITIAKTAQSRVGAWKGSPLTLLFSDVQYEIKDKVSGQMNRCDGLQQTVGRTKVVLESQPTGNWMFKVA